MVKYISVICRPLGTNRDDVIDYWLNVHAPLVKRLLPGLRKYLISFALPSPVTNEPPQFDGVVELYFDDLQSMQKALSSPGWQSAERKASSNKVIDYARLQAFYVEEHTIPV
jgi:uncharacterized protein (TIGR02118 family)